MNIEQLRMSMIHITTRNNKVFSVSINFIKIYELITGQSLKQKSSNFFRNIKSATVVWSDHRTV